MFRGLGAGRCAPEPVHLCMMGWPVGRWGLADVCLCTCAAVQPVLLTSAPGWSTTQAGMPIGCASMFQEPPVSSGIYLNYFLWTTEMSICQTVVCNSVMFSRWVILRSTSVIHRWVHDALMSLDGHVQWASETVLFRVITVWCSNKGLG